MRWRSSPTTSARVATSRLDRCAVNGLGPLSCGADPDPCGSTIYQVNIAYRAAPICEIRLRTTSRLPLEHTLSSRHCRTAPAPRRSHNDLNPGITIGNRKSALFAFYSYGGVRPLGVTIGYTPPDAELHPVQRQRSTRPRHAQDRGPLQAGEERVIDLGSPVLAAPSSTSQSPTLAQGGGYVPLPVPRQHRLAEQLRASIGRAPTRTSPTEFVSQLSRHTDRAGD